MNLYYPLHVHSAQGSVGDSILRIKDYVTKAKEYELDSIALTDHGSLSAMYAFADECKKNNIKPIIGMEAYEVEDASLKDKEHNKRYHLVLLAKTNEGLRNLIAIHNKAATKDFYTKPRTDIKTLRKYGKGIICLSACVAGRIPQAIIKDDAMEAIRLIKEYKSCFDDFYLEIQPAKFIEQIKINDAIVELAEYTNTPIVATNDIHYLDRKDVIAHNAHVLLGRKGWTQKKNYEEIKPMDENDLIYPDTCYWFMDRQTIEKTFVKTKYVTDSIIQTALNNTSKIAEQCVAKLPSEIHMPKFSSDKDEKSILHDLCFKKLEDLIQYKINPAKYIDTLYHELDIIDELGFNGYFLIVQDYIKWARKNNIPVGPGRGSAAGSLVSYLLDISKADPIKYKLMFERFLDPQRAAIPDIDVDFSTAKRDKMFEYAIEKYGYSHCSLVSTFHIRKAKGAIRDSARVLGYKPVVGDDIAKQIPVVYYSDDGDKMMDLDIQTSIKVSDNVKAMSKKYPDIFELAQKLEGLPSSIGLHAAGILISPIPLSDNIPLIKSNLEQILATSLDLHDAENNFVKFDFLALAYLEIIDSTEKDIGYTFDYENESLFEDENVWSMIGSKHTTGIFQIASNVYKTRMNRLRPTTIEELATCLALVRGPCITSKLDEKYIRILEGKDDIEYLCPEYNNPTQNTFGIPIFQEQIMKIFVNFGFSLSEGYKYIKASAKKKVDEVKKYKNEFIVKAKQRKVDECTAERIFNALEKSSLYSFNKSHAVSYALLSYCSAYLKYHYPLPYMKNLLTNVFTRQDKDKIKDVVAECRYLGIKFLPADINKSSWNFTVEDDKIRIGICAFKGIGEKAFKHIEELRPFLSFDDFIDKIEARLFNKNTLNIAIVSGMLDDFIDAVHYSSRLDLVSAKCDEIPEEIKVAGNMLSIKQISSSSLSYQAKIEELLTGCVFISTEENSLPSINLIDIKPKETINLTAIIKRLVKPTEIKGATITLLTGNGLINCRISSYNYNKLSKTLDTIKRNIPVNITLLKHSNGYFYVQSLLQQLEETNSSKQLIKVA